MPSLTVRARICESPKASFCTVRFRKVVFYAVRDIKAAEELCYDYGEGFKRDCGIELI